MRIKHDPRFPLELRNTSLGELSVSPLPISYTVLSGVPITINGTFSQTQVQSVADAIRELSKLIPST